MIDNDITMNSDILIVDDSIFILKITKQILEGKYDVRVAQSAEAAYMLMRRHTPDLILLDLEMPKVNGYEFLEKIKTTPEWKDIPVIFLTGTDDRKKEEQALALGAVDYILKPIAEGVLLKRIKFHLELKLFQKNIEGMVASRTEELLKTQEELRKAAETAREALRVKSAFLANMSHEIRTPMNSIMGLTELAMDSDISPQTRGYLTRIRESTRLLLRIINNILDISKIESGKMDLENVPFNLHSVLMYCQSMILPEIHEKKLELKFSEPLVEKQLLGDPVRLYQALLNLFSNAVKFTAAGEVTFSASVRKMSLNDATIYFEVEDSGIGMTEEQVSSIFEPFTQADSSITRSYGGTGLGLTITKNIVEMMGGTLVVESTPGAGSRFSFEITFQTTDAESLFDDVFGPTALNQLEKPQFDGEVLICEDNSMNQQVVCEHLARVGLKSKVAKNGKEGYEMVESRMLKGLSPFDMIFMDMQMPVMDGFEATEKINALKTGTPVVAMTANVMTTDIEEYKRRGFLHCIGKPFQTWDLWSCLLRYLPQVDKPAIGKQTSAQEDEELQKKLQISFAQDNQTKFDDIRAAITANDLTLARRLVHTLKGNAGLIGETKLQNIAAVIEVLIKNGEIQTAMLHIGTLKTELGSVLDGLKPLLEAPVETVFAEPLNPGQTRELFEKLEPLLKDRNAECMNLLDEIRVAPGAEELAHQIEEYDFKNALETLSKLKGRG